MFDFPDSPSPGQTYDTGAGVIYEWTGAGWKVKPTASGGGTGAATSISVTPPASPVVGQLWWQNTTGYMMIYYSDPDATQQWVQVNAQPGSIGEAPLDGQQYARQAAGWSVVVAGGAGGGISEAPTDGGLYLRKGSTASWGQGVPMAGGTYVGNVAFNQGLQVNAVNSSNYAAQANTNYAGLGGFIGFGANGSTYTISGYGGYGAYVNGGTNYFSQLTCTSCIFNAATTTSSATGYLSTGGGLYRSTSSGYYKQAVEQLDPAFADKVLALQTVFYRPNSKTADPTEWSRYGFLTEDAYNIDFRFTTCSEAMILDENGKPVDLMMELTLPDENGEMETQMVPSGQYAKGEGIAAADVDLKAIVACLLDVVRRQGERIAALEAANAPV